MTKVLVIGGGGFIGSHVSEVFLLQGHSVQIVDKTKGKYDPYLQELGAEFIYGDFTDDSLMDKCISSDIDIIIHLASTTVPKSSNENPIYDIETNLISTVKLLNLASKRKIPRFIFSSSGGTVYGENNVPIKEDTLPRPNCSYGIVKLCIENYLEMFNKIYGLNYTVLRMSNAYGPRQPLRQDQGLIPMVINRALVSQPIDVWGDGTAIRDYVYVKDIALAFLAATQPIAANHVFNIGSGKGYSVKEVIDLISVILNKEIKVNYTEQNKPGVSKNILNFDKAKSMLGWIPAISLENGIQEYIESL